ncbi:YbjN domain-containing protein [Dethiosulfatarculus sandiegensis]|uniref:Molecular chaperone Tir n=1 Tax=Dethiosulfatarculus sandiegensis TaxID=1429043 RepID=A0A0D2GH50_9BACT|nr:YbjN domain-containing protein [Dethiosulfatarculus sandiegensis]KIX14252.1 molecular chaperone Tir [Dethiosulfatarculus sandiegensis]
MSEKFELVKAYLEDMQIAVTTEIPEEEIVIVEDEDKGIKNLIIDCEDTIVVLEQSIMPVPADPKDLFKRLLQLNRSLVHGAFTLDDEGKKVLFRDTLQLANLDRNELEASIQALSLGLAEYGSELLTYIPK